MIKTIIFENKPTCLNQLVKFLNAIKEQKQRINIIRNDKNIADYETTLINIHVENYYIWREHLIEYEPFKFGDAKIKYFGHNIVNSQYFFKFIKHNSECNVVKMGVGHSIDAEMELKKNYPQCTFLSINPDSVINADLIETKLKGTVIKRTIGAEDSYNAQTGEPAIGFFDFIYYNAKLVIDLLMLDVEGTEFSIFQLLTKQYNQLPVIICQINVVIHPRPEYLNTFLKQQFLRNFETFIRHSKFAMLKNDMFKPDEFFHRIFNPEIFHSIFFVNYVEKECMEKFFC